jgi:hypothetical protein
MNNGNDEQNDRLEGLLRKSHLPEPSPLLERRITAEATRLWRETSAELSWRIPIRYLAASAAAAVLIIWLANFSSGCFVARWQVSKSLAMSRQPPDLDAFPDLPYDPFAKYLVSISRESPATDASGWHHYVETMQKLLDEA